MNERTRDRRKKGMVWVSYSTTRYARQRNLSDRQGQDNTRCLFKDICVPESAAIPAGLAVEGERMAVTGEVLVAEAAGRG